MLLLLSAGVATGQEKQSGTTLSNPRTGKTHRASSSNLSQQIPARHGSGSRAGASHITAANHANPVIIRNMDEWFDQGWAFGKKCQPGQEAIVDGYDGGVCDQNGQWRCAEGYVMRHNKKEHLGIMHCERGQ
jgi:hypothetical protein